VADARLAAAIALLASVAVLAIARPLLFTSLDPDVARGLGLPLRALGIGFFALLAVVAAEATQAVGALLLLGLLAAPGGAARLLTDDPWRGLALSAALALASMWGGLALSFEFPSLPPSFTVIALATGLFVLAALRSRWGRDRGDAPSALQPASRIER
jgi:zinc/manganese transport system permease protein